MSLAARQMLADPRPEVDGYALVNMAERDIHVDHDGPMELCSKRICLQWVDWLRDQGVIQ